MTSKRIKELEKGCGKKVYMHFGVPVCCGDFNLGVICRCQDCVNKTTHKKGEEQNDR